MCKGYYISSSYNLTEFRNKFRCTGVIFCASAYLTNYDIFSYFENNNNFWCYNFRFKLVSVYFRLHRHTLRYNVSKNEKNIVWQTLLSCMCRYISLLLRFNEKIVREQTRKEEKRKRLQIVENFEAHQIQTYTYASIGGIFFHSSFLLASL